MCLRSGNGAARSEDVLARCRRMPTPCGARRQAAGNAIACPMRPIKRTFGSLCLPCNPALILERMQVPQTRPRECRSLPTRPAAACRHGSLVSGADLRKQPTKWCNLAAATAVAQISAPSLRPVHRRGTLGFPGEGPGAEEHRGKLMHICTANVTAWSSFFNAGLLGLARRSRPCGPSRSTGCMARGRSAKPGRPWRSKGTGPP